MTGGGEQQKPKVETEHKEEHDEDVENKEHEVEQHQDEHEAEKFNPAKFSKNRYSLPESFSYVKEPIEPLTGPTNFDNVLFGDLKLRQVPSFLWQHKGKNGWLRTVNYLDRRVGGLNHPAGGLKRGQYAFLTIAFFSLLAHPFEKDKFQTKVNAIIQNKFHRDNYAKMHPIEKKYYYIAIARAIGDH